MKRITRKYALLMLLAVLMLSFGLALAAGETLPRSLMSSGGGMISQSGTNLHSAVGQPVVGAVQNGLTLCSGYLCSGEAPPVSGRTFNIYLPAVIR